MRAIVLTAFAVFLSAPASAQELEPEIDAATRDAIFAVATRGYANPDAAIPATPHQEQVLEGNQQGESSQAPSGPSSAGQADVPASPHQQQTLEEGSGEQAADLVAEAREMAAAGDEDGCMQKVTQAKDLLGVE